MFQQVQQKHKQSYDFKFEISAATAAVTPAASPTVAVLSTLLPTCSAIIDPTAFAALIEGPEIKIPIMKGP